MGLASPLVLGSYVAEAVLPFAIAVLVVRLRAEERLLAQYLEGYDAYLGQTRFRLIPRVF